MKEVGGRAGRPRLLPLATTRVSMSRSLLARVAGTLLVVLVILSPAAIAPTAITADSGSAVPVERLGGPRLVVLRHDDTYFPFHVPSPAAVQLRPQAANIVVNYNPATCMGTPPDWPPDAQTAFEYAVSVWETLLDASQTVEIDACWGQELPPGVLGWAGPAEYYGDFAGASSPGTWYPAALANELYGSDLNPAGAEIVAGFSSAFNWHFDTDGSPGASQIDFATVVLHEVCHGLGFGGSMVVSGGAGSWGWGQEPPYPAVYDRFTENGASQPLLDFENGSTALGTQLTSQDIFFSGAQANAANGGTAPELYAPSSWLQWSSYSHLDESFNGTLNALMTYSLANGESEHDPGPVALGMLEDMGWTAADPVPTVTSITPGSAMTGDVVNVTNLAGSNFLPGASVALTKSGQPSIPGTSVVMVSSSQITCSLDLSGAATGLWNVKVTNPDAQWGQLTNGFVIMDETWTKTYLPLVLWNHP